jgi:hypothetical protein
MENCAIPLGPTYMHTTWCSHLTEDHIVLKSICLLPSVPASFIASEVIFLLLAVAVIKLNRHRNILFRL